MVLGLGGLGFRGLWLRVQGLGFWRFYGVPGVCGGFRILRRSVLLKVQGLLQRDRQGSLL